MKPVHKRRVMTDIVSHSIIDFLQQAVGNLFPIDFAYGSVEQV
jgi:hypothetical protein